jgi:hypothetical protein
MASVDISKFIPSTNGKGVLTVAPPEALHGMVGTLPLMQANGIASYSEDPALTAEELKEVLPSIALRTLAISGIKGKMVSVQLEKVKIIRGSSPQLGGGDGGGILIDRASPVIMRDVEVTGDGKGAGISITNSSKLQLERLNIHDMIWSPYVGDNVFDVASLKSIKEDFSWNTFPIYQFNAASNRFVRARIREQITGLEVRDCADVNLLDSKIARLQTKLGGKLIPLQSDGVTLANVTKIRVRNCDVSEVWEGIDFSDIRGEDFVYENCTATDTFTFGFKLAHPKRNGKMINCTSYRAGDAGFVMEPEVQNVEFIQCHALETGSNGYWTKDDGSRIMTTGGFRLGTRAGLPTPTHIKFDRCTAINTNQPTTMDFGFACDGGFDAAEREIIAVGCTTQGARVDGIYNIAIK